MLSSPFSQTKPGAARVLRLESGASGGVTDVSFPADRFIYSKAQRPQKPKAKVLWPLMSKDERQPEASPASVSF